MSSVGSATASVSSAWVGARECRSTPSKSAVDILTATNVVVVAMTPDVLDGGSLVGLSGVYIPMSRSRSFTMKLYQLTTTNMVVVAVTPHVVNGGGLSVGLYIYPVNQIMSNEDCWQWMSLLTTTDMVVVAVAPNVLDGIGDIYRHRESIGNTVCRDCGYTYLDRRGGGDGDA